MQVSCDDATTPDANNTDAFRTKLQISPGRPTFVVVLMFHQCRPLERSTKNIRNNSWCKMLLGIKLGNILGPTCTGTELSKST